MNIYKHDGPGTPAMLTYMGTASEEIVIGEALVLKNGYLTKCGATEMPQFMAQGKGQGTLIPVIPVVAGDSYIAEFSVDASVVKVGDTVQLDETATKLTATNGGTAVIQELFGNAKGDKAAVVFVAVSSAE